MPRSRVPLPAPLAKAARRFERWRARRTTRRIPEELWALAAELGARHGVSRTARALHVHYEDLKKRVLQSSAREPEQATPPPTFVEIRTAPPSADEPRGCRVEFENTSGEKMRVELNVVDRVDLAELARLFLGRGE